MSSPALLRGILAIHLMVIVGSTQAQAKSSGHRRLLWDTRRRAPFSDSRRRAPTAAPSAAPTSSSSTFSDSRRRAPTAAPSAAPTSSSSTFSDSRRRAPTATPTANPTSSSSTVVAVDWLSGFSSVSARSLSVSADSTVSFIWLGSHNVHQLPNQAAFDNCDFESGVLLGSSSPVAYVARTAGTFYFGCSVATHCISGQKLELSVTQATLALSVTLAGIDAAQFDAPVQAAFKTAMARGLNTTDDRVEVRILSRRAVQLMVELDTALPASAVERYLIDPGDTGFVSTLNLEILARGVRGVTVSSAGLESTPTSNQDTASASDSDSNNILIIGIAAAGGLLIIIAAVVAVVRMARSRSSTCDKNSEHMRSPHVEVPLPNKVDVKIVTEVGVPRAWNKHPSRDRWGSTTSSSKYQIPGSNSRGHLEHVKQHPLSMHHGMQPPSMHNGMQPPKYRKY